VGSECSLVGWRCLWSKGGRGIGSWCWCKLQWELLLLECQACGCVG
jgi:hypothetical protein